MSWFGLHLGKRSVHIFSRLGQLLRAVNDLSWLVERRLDPYISTRERLTAIQKGGSLLPVGVIQVAGEFRRGDTVGVFEPSGKEIAKGLSNYASSDLDEIRWKAIRPD